MFRKSLLAFLLLSLPAGAQVVIQGGTVVAGGGSTEPCTNCALTNVANDFTLTNTFPALNVTNGINGLPMFENTGLFNIGLGVGSTNTAATGYQNLGIGDGTLAVLTTGYDNVGLGVGSLAVVTTGFEDTGFGTFALGAVTTGQKNAALGSSALFSLTTGNDNIAQGPGALADLITGSGNVGVGYLAGAPDNGIPQTFTVLNNSIYIGNLSSPGINNVSNQIIIGYQATGSASNQTVIGNSSITAATIYGVPTFPQLGGSGAGCIGISNSGLTSVTTCGGGGGGTIFQVNGTNLISSSTVNFVPSSNISITNPSAGNIDIGVTSMAFSLITAGTNTNALLIGSGGSLGVTGSGTIAATSAPYSGLTGSVPTWNQNTTGTSGGLTGSPAITVSNVTDSGLTPGDCVQASTGGLLVTTGSACGSGGGSGPTIQTNGVNNASQSNLNFTNTATVLFTNPSVGIEEATVPTATSSAVGVSYFDNTTIGITSGALHVISPGNSTLLGFNGSGTYTGFTLGTGLAFSGSTLNATGITGTLSTANCIAKELTSTSVTCSNATDSGTVFSISDSGGLQLTGSTPGVITLSAGSGTLSGLGSNYYGYVGPVTGGTPYLLQNPSTATAGFIEYAAPATLYGQNVATASGFVHMEWNFAANTYAPGIYAVGNVIGSATAVNAGHVASLSGFYVQGGCSGPPTIDICDTTTSSCSSGLALNNTGNATLSSPGVSYSAGDVLQMKIVTAGTGCSGGNHAVSAQMETP